MHLSISAQFTLKDKPKEYRGLVREHYVFGKKPVSLAGMCMSVLEVIFTYYGRLCDADELNADLNILRNWLLGIEFKSDNTRCET